MHFKTKDRTGPRGTGLSGQYDEAASQWSHHCSCSGHCLPAYNENENENENDHIIVLVQVTKSLLTMLKPMIFGDIWWDGDMGSN